MTDSEAQKARMELWARLTVLIVPWLCFGRALSYPFALSWDDARFIANNQDVRQPRWDAFVRMFTTVQFEAYHPLHLLSYWLDVPWAGTDLQLMATLVHAVSLALWVLALALSYELLRKLGAPLAAALLGTLVIGVHPAQVEVVCWASARKDILALLFVVASLLAQLSAAGPWSGRAWLARGLYLCAILSKTTALPLPLFAFTLDVLVRKRSWREALRWHLPSGLLAAGVSLAVFSIWREHGMLRQTVGDESFALVRFVQTFGHQFGTALWPNRLAPMYASQSIASWDVRRTSICVVYVLACALALRSQRKLLASGLLGFGLFLLPAANIVPLYFPLQDRYASLPLFALGVAIAGLGTDAQTSGARRKPARNLWIDLGFVALCGLCARTVQYAGMWQSELRLWGHAVRAQPDADYAYLKLGEVRREAGDLEGAIKAYHGAIRVAPLRTLAHAGLFEVVARRDERIFKLQPARARQLAEQYYQRLSNMEALHAFPAQLASMGYMRAVELPIQALLVVDAVPEGLVLQSAQGALRAGRRSLAKFYLHELKEAPKAEALAALYAEPYYRVVP